MTARGRLLARLVTALLAMVGLVLVGAGPAVAESNTIAGQYVALGDSYAAGQGGSEEYLDPACLESENGYPYLLDAEKGIHLQTNAACTGAKTSDVISDQLSALNRATRLVTLTVGAADLNLTRVLVACTPVPGPECQTAIQAAFLLLPLECGDESELGRRLTELYALVAAAAPKAHIVVTGYPYLFEQPAAADPNADVINQVNMAITLLNCAIEKAVADAEASGISIEYVDVTGVFSGHGIGSAVPYINPLEAGLPAAFHPNAAGYVAYAEAISEALQSA